MQISIYSEEYQKRGRRIFRGMKAKHKACDIAAVAEYANAQT